jgi:sulfate transport system ATP-binding protein
MQFIGQVNVFHGRVEAGRALLGPLALDYPEHPAAEALPAAGYARPFELDLDREEGEGGGLWATLRHVTPAGAVVRLELDDDGGRLLQVELTRERYVALGARPGERLYARPQRVRVFVEPEREAIGAGTRR